MLSCWPARCPGAVPSLSDRSGASGTVGQCAGGRGRKRVQRRGPLSLGGAAGGAGTGALAAHPPESPAWG
eukprot:3623816-Alexandrium_andersonii.AAC.1